MQTFLPYADFEVTASVLDRQRLGKQRVETLQIMSALVKNTGWVHHPATNMWRGYEGALLLYQAAICNEWVVARGYSDTCLLKTEELYWTVNDKFNPEMPWWLGDIDIHISHQSNLVRKNFDYYSRAFPNVPDDLPYVWPV